MSKKYHTSWNEIDQHVQNLSSSIIKRLKDSDIEKYDLIISLGRGGMIPSRMLSDYIGVNKIKFLDVHKYSQYETNSSGILCIDSNFDWKSLENKNILLVDDVYDTGETIHSISEMILSEVSECLIASAVLYCNINKLLDTSDCPTYHSGSYNPENTWIVFPWENDKIIL